MSSFGSLAFFHSEMAESFENLDNILRDQAKDKVQKKSCQTGTRTM